MNHSKSDLNIPVYACYSFGCGRHRLKFCIRVIGIVIKKYCKNLKCGGCMVSVNPFASEGGLNIFWSFEPDN